MESEQQNTWQSNTHDDEEEYDSNDDSSDDLYSDDIEDDTIDRNILKNRKTKITPPRIPTSSREKREFSPEYNSKQSNKSYKLNNKKIKQNVKSSVDVSTNQTWNIKICISIIVLVVIFMACYISADLLTSQTESSITTATQLPNINNIMKDFSANIGNIKRKFKNQHLYIWNEIFSGVIDIIKHPEKRSLIFLFSNDDDLMSCFARMVANASKAVLNSEQILNLTPSDLGNDFGSVIDKYKEPIKDHKIVIIENLLDVHTEAMRALHNLCDSENPLVNQTIYILTMITNDYKKDEQPIDFVEKQLIKKLTNKINQDKIHPLIARITDGAIIPVQPEPDFTSCPLRY